MNWFFRTFSYTVGRKLIMAATGLFLVLYLIEHLIGNLLLLIPDNGDVYNAYSHFMVNNIFIRVVEVLLFLSFAFHIVDGIGLYLRNKKSRPVKYKVNNPSANSFWSSRNMAITGSIIFIFLIIHLKDFFFSYRVSGTVTNLYEEAVRAFSNPYYSIFYVIAMILIGLHLHHGFSSAFQTLGMRHPKYYPFLRGLGVFLAVVISVGFSIIPIFFLIKSF